MKDRNSYNILQLNKTNTLSQRDKTIIAVSATHGNINTKTSQPYKG